MILYAVTIFFSAFLLFQIQPMIAKTILPWFGGSAAVWTTCLLFFQIALLGGYLYAHLAIRYLTPKKQTYLHVALLAVSLLLLPVIPNAAWKPAGAEDPALRILGLLAVTIGLPYFLLSATSPLLQSWYSRSGESMPYRLFAVSNAGSLLALLSYPVVMEPNFTTRRQALGWSCAYACFAVLCSAIAVRSRRSRTWSKLWARASSGPRELETKPRWRLQLIWLALPACASTLLLAITNHISQNIAAIPFLWILPLSLYLLSFILCFEGRGLYRRYPYLPLLAVSLGCMAYALTEGSENLGIVVLIPLFASGLFICCMVCHGELARLKPHPRFLTSFYLMISAGGALGGILVGLVAPHLLHGYFELPVALACCAVLVLMALRMDRSVTRASAWRWQSLWWASAAGAVALCVFLGYTVHQFTGDSRVLVRNFYGVLRVSDEGEGDSGVRKLTHGTINHGEQYLDPILRKQPTTYYGPNTGIGLTLRVKGGQPLRAGLIGLGAGTLAAYGGPGDYYRFYEINPLVIQLAQTEFFYLRDSNARLDIALGDARLSLEREPKQNFDVLAVDAFSSDSIPVHLLTREAFELYFRHLKDNGVLAVHVSNKHLDLIPIVRMASAALGKKARLIDTDDDDDHNVFGATWVLVSDSQAFFDSSRIRAASTAIPYPVHLRLWTDDYSNLFQIMKFK